MDEALHHADGICILSSDRTVSYISRSLAGFLGLAADGALGRPVDGLFSLADTDGIPMAWDLLLAQQGPVEATLRAVQTSAEVRCSVSLEAWDASGAGYIAVQIHPIVAQDGAGSNGNAAAVSPVAATLLELSTVAVLVFGREGRLLLVNSAAETLLDRSRDQLIGQSIDDVRSILGDSSPQELPQEPPTGGEGDPEGAVDLLRFTTAAGSKRDLRRSFRAVSFSERGPSFFLLTLADVTDELRTEEELRKMHKMESVRNLVGGIAHDFNDLITAILGNISLAKLENATPEEIHDRLVEAEQALRQAEILTHELSAVSEKVAQQPKANLSDLVQSAAAFVLRGTNVKLRASIASSLPTPSIDPNRLAQVVQNLVMNAQQAMPEGGIVEITADRDELTYLPGRRVPGVRLSVRDHGEGIPTVYLKRIFEPFFTTRRTGSGLGLTVAQSIVAEAGGRIQVDSQAGVGTVFTVAVPSAQAPIAKSQNGDKAKACANKKVLIMDDDRFIRDILGRMMDRLGCRASLAADGNEAVYLYQEAMDSGHPFDAAIMDLTVPGGMGGKDAVRRILKLDPEATVVVTSGLPNDPVLADYERFGFRGSVAKPFTFEEIAETLAAVLSG